MTAKAVIVLNSLARDEFERDWHGWEEPFSFLDDPENPVETLEAVIDGRVASLPARVVAEGVLAQKTSLRDDLEEDLAESEEYLTDDEIEEKVDALLLEFWSSQLEGPEEYAAVFEARVEYLVRGFQEFVAYSTIVADRVPAIRARIVEHVQNVGDEMTRLLQSWTDPVDGTG